VSLESRIAALAQAVGADIKALLAASGGAPAIAQAAATLAQGQTLAVAHAADAARKRIVQVYAAPVPENGPLTPSLQGADARATASGVYGNVAQYQPWCAFRLDTAAGGDAYRMWEPQGNANEWIAWDFGVPAEFSGVSFCTLFAQYGPRGFKVQGSADGAAWADVADISTAWASNAYQAWSFPAATYRRARLLVTTGGGGGYILVGGLRFTGGVAVAPSAAAPADYTVTLAGPETTAVTKTSAGSALVTVNVMV